MTKYSNSKQLILNTKNFLNIELYTKSTKIIKNNDIFYGWGRKKSGFKAISEAKKNNASFSLLEDGFIRSIGLGVDGAESFSIVEDDVGIYYDATVPSGLENILKTYDFKSDVELMKKASEAIELIKSYNISKYNHTIDMKDSYFKSSENRVLIIAQTFGDSSLEYGILDNYTTHDMIQDALNENEDSQIYIKIHPDVLSGKKDSDIDISSLDNKIKVISEDFNPISLLKYFDKVYTKTSGMGFEALLVGCKCICFGMPFYAGWGITDDRSVCKRRKRSLSVEEVFAASYILYTQYYNPYSQKPSDIIDTIETILIYRDIERKSDKKVFLFGFSRWKHGYIRPFLKEYKKENIYFVNPIFKTHYDLAIKKGLDASSDVLIWGRKEFQEIEDFAVENELKVIRVEDGFIRSVGLGSDLTAPYSLVFDDEGIYFDPTKSSRLETIINEYDFKSDTSLMNQARKLRQKIITTKISKYNSFEHRELNFPKNINIVLVIGQVEDDASIKYGTDGMTNLDLIKEVSRYNKDKFIIYKPHPDVLSGNRVGDISQNIAQEYCDEVIVDISLHAILEKVDEVHTMTSLTGFEALVLGKEVFTYGMPFYAGWGLTTDSKICTRRARIVNIDELIAATLILYPRYRDPKGENYCDAGVLIDRLQHEKNKIDSSLYYRYKMKTYSYFSRNIQKLISWFK